MSGNTLPPNKRYISGHNDQGRSIYLNSPDQALAQIPGFGHMARSFATSSIPAIMENDVDVRNYSGTSSEASFNRPDIVIPTGGVNVVVLDIAPSGDSHMHRTQSIDFSICVIGEIEHELDGGEKVTLKPGDHIVQRGTMHKWKNASNTEPARAVCVIVPATSFEIPGTGKMLVEEHLGRVPGQ
ncbi:uncharacterized protein AB675_10904 [Cyphellophora attinorum]|uniref:Cupin type-2 domain-containing protein n=1 Tax=Cyphellophora attinorum TaxID=1664694 RepID=A0A0N0NN11_9EURO|nr:uncharacterized protein AB675_10904 [Phialophora attinorum]KPI40978.1 hypothetical protein AB675_10904 [Phialophora attinorum]